MRQFFLGFFIATTLLAWSQFSQEELNAFLGMNLLMSSDSGNMEVDFSNDFIRVDQLLLNKQGFLTKQEALDFARDDEDTAALYFNEPSGGEVAMSGVINNTTLQWQFTEVVGTDLPEERKMLLVHDGSVYERTHILSATRSK